MTADHRPTMGTPPPTSRRANPPPAPRSTAPPAFPTATFTPRRNRRHLKLTLIALAAVLLIAAAVMIIQQQRRTAAHNEAVETLMGQMQLEQQDSLPHDTWQGGVSTGGTNYM